jgi:hypothetical protein
MYVAGRVPDILRMEDFGELIQKRLGREGLIRNAEATPKRPPRVYDYGGSMTGGLYLPV